jgi:quercetin dioxygenase-like cupin family protein
MDGPALVKWSNMRPSWGLPGATTPGSMRAGFDHVFTSSAKAHWVLIGRGQSSPLHSSAADHLIVVVEGKVEFQLGDDRYVLEPMDLFVFPSEAPYRYTNISSGDAMFLSVSSSAGSWPPEANQYLPST